jgi:NADPH-dependent 2,4-dienoyl-CoA reductase/sulfur reductase-like enzyme
MKTIIIGGVAAGMSTAAKLRRLDINMEITVYEKGSDLSYSGCGMPYYLGDIITDEQKLIARTKDDFTKENIEVFLNHEVIQVNSKDKTVIVRDLTSNKEVIDHYDKLLIGTGTKAIRTNVPGSDKVDIYVLNQLDDMREIKQVIDKTNSVAVIGGGYIGIEVAENFAHKGIKVHIIELADQLLRVFDKTVAKLAQEKLETAGVEVHLEEKLISYEQSKGLTIVYTDKSSYEVDMVIEAIGVRPATEFLKDTEIEMLKNGAIIVNERCETSLKDIYSAGDCATYHHLIKDELVYVPLGTHANKTGRIVAENIAGNDEVFKGIVGSNIIKVFDYAFAKTGLGIDEAKRLNLDYDYVDVTAKNQTGYYPGAKKIFMRIVYEKQTGVLKGAQLVGEKGVSDRINIMALAITKSLTAKEFSQLDFAYAPPFSPVWDPLQIATNQIKV